MQVIVDAEQSTAIFELLSLFGYCVFKFSTKDSPLLNCYFFGDIGCLFNSYRQRRIKPHKKSQKVSYKALKVIQEYTKAYKESDKHPLETIQKTYTELGFGDSLLHGPTSGYRPVWATYVVRAATHVLAYCLPQFLLISSG